MWPGEWSFTASLILCSAAFSCIVSRIDFLYVQASTSSFLSYTCFLVIFILHL